MYFLKYFDTIGAEFETRALTKLVNNIRIIYPKKLGKYSANPYGCVVVHNSFNHERKLSQQEHLPYGKAKPRSKVAR